MNADALRKLIAEIKAGLPSPTSWRNFIAVPVGDIDNPNTILAHRAYHGSLDAASALHDALLPDWHYHVGSIRSGALASVWHEPGKCVASHSAELPDNPSRAWLLAILRAKLSDAENEH